MHCSLTATGQASKCWKSKVSLSKTGLYVNKKKTERVLINKKSMQTDNRQHGSGVSFNPNKFKDGIRTCICT